MAAASTNNSASRPIFLLVLPVGLCCPGCGATGLPGQRARDRMLPAIDGAVGLGPGLRTEVRHAAFSVGSAPAALCTPYETIRSTDASKDRSTRKHT